jgi:hypothetical protein
MSSWSSHSATPTVLFLSVILCPCLEPYFITSLTNISHNFKYTPGHFSETINYFVLESMICFNWSTFV